MTSSGQVPKAVIGRMSLYLRELQHVLRDGNETISSVQLGKLLGVTDAQVRKDLAYFGQFGYPGIGYKCIELIEEIRKILGTHKNWPVILVGCGNLGRALMGYKGFGRQSFNIVAAIDVDPKKIGTQIGAITIESLESAEAVVQANQIKLAILTVPAQVAQKVADHLLDAGVTGILNFSPVTLNLPDHASAVGVDLAIKLEQLSFAVVKKLENS